MGVDLWLNFQKKFIWFIICNLQKSFRNPAPTPSSSPVLGATSSSGDGTAAPAGSGVLSGLTDIQQQMVVAFATQSGMNAEWAAK